MKDSAINNSDNESLEKDKERLTYRQYVLIILLTLIMILGTLFLSLLVTKLISKGRNMNYNTIVAKLPPTSDDPGGTDSFVFTYHEVDEIGNGIYIENMFPTKDSEGMAFSGDNYTFDFKLLVGQKALNHDYEVTAVKQEMSNLSGNYAKIYLEVNGTRALTCFRPNGAVRVYNEYPNASIDILSDLEKTLYTGTVSKQDISKGQIDFTLKMWLAEETPMNDTVFNKAFAIKINIYVR